MCIGVSPCVPLLRTSPCCSDPVCKCASLWPSICRSTLETVNLGLSFYVQTCVCECVCVHTYTHTCSCLNYPYSHTHMKFCAVILEAATHVRANEFQLKVLSISVPKFGRLVVPVCLPMTFCGYMCVLVRYCIWLRCPDSGAKNVCHTDRVATPFWCL